MSGDDIFFFYYKGDVDVMHVFKEATDFFGNF